MKKIYFIVIGLFFSLNAHAVFLQYCSNFGRVDNPVSFSYTSCVNSNFNTIGREVNPPAFFRYCSNFGSRVDYFFISCINDNFRSAQYTINDPNLFLSHCSNYRDTELEFSFTSCVQRNYSEIERSLNRRN